MELGGLDSEQTIVAIATPPAAPGAGCALRGIVRLSGPDCFDVVGRVFQVGCDVGNLQSEIRNPKSEILPGFRVVRGRLRLGESLWLPAVGYRFRAGRSYTGQNMFEFQLPGSAALAEQVVELLLNAGARAAEPGEFTLRAVLSGRIDLPAAEAVAELIAARSDGQLRAAMQLADGALSRRVRAINDALADLLAEIEAGLDFADEPIEFISAERVSAALAAARAELEELQANAGSFETLERRPTVALFGRPNVGKSTLLNRLSGVDRALCSPLAGTTRDVLAAPLSLPDGEVLLLDGPGLDQGLGDRGQGLGFVVPPTGGSPDALASTLQTADLLLWVLDATQPGGEQLAGWNPASPGQRPVIIVLNKVDLAGLTIMDFPNYGFPRLPITDFLAVSAATGQGLDQLRSAINARIFANASRPAEGLMLNARHRAALLAAGQAAARAGELLAGGLDAAGDLLASEIREAMDHLGQISGQVMTEDILTRIFSRFCVGK